MIPKTFDELWNNCEEFHKENLQDEDIIAILDELQIKINLYKVLEFKKQIPKEDLKLMKSKIMGEILLVLTKISLKDNINVFSTLLSALNSR